MFFNEMVIKPFVGTHIDSFKKEMEELSKKYKCTVIGNFNGKILTCTYEKRNVIWKD